MNAKRDGHHIRIYGAYSIKESLKEIDGAFYDAADTAWVVPFSKDNAATLMLLGVRVEDDLLTLVEPHAAEEEEPLLHMPIKAKAYQHQIKAYNFALRLFGIGGDG